MNDNTESHNGFVTLNGALCGRRAEDHLVMGHTASQTTLSRQVLHNPHESTTLLGPSKQTWVLPTQIDPRFKNHTWFQIGFNPRCITTVTSLRWRTRILGLENTTSPKLIERRRGGFGVGQQSAPRANPCGQRGLS